MEVVDRQRLTVIEGADGALEKRARFLAEQAVGYAMNAKESWYPDGHLDYDMFSGLLTDAIVQTVLKPLLSA